MGLAEGDGEAIADICGDGLLVASSPESHAASVKISAKQPKATAGLNTSAS